MRKGLAVVAVLSSLVAGGCSSGGSEPAPQQSAPPPAPAGPARTAPAKSLELADKCSILRPEQLQQLGADQPPRPLAMNGNPECHYGKGGAGTRGGWSVSVGPKRGETTARFSALHQGQKKQVTIGGYPAVTDVAGPMMNCLVSVDVSDQGSLSVTSQVRPGDKSTDACQLATKTAEAAVQNLPNA